MKKQKNKFVLKFNGGDDEQEGVSGNEENTNGGSDKKSLYINLCLYGVIVCYSILVITYVIIFSKYLYNLKSSFINAQNTQQLCKNMTYENETVRNKMYILFQKKKSSKEQLQKTMTTLLSFIIVTYIIIIILSLITVNDNESFTTPLTAINLARFGLSVGGGSLGSPSLNSEGLKTPKFIIITIIFLLTVSGFYLIKNTMNSLFDSMSDYATKIAFLKEKVFNSINLNEVNISYNRENGIEEPSNDKTNGALITLENNIIRRLLHSDDSGGILNLTEAYAKYNSLRQNKTVSGQTDVLGQDKLIGFIDFIRNSDDYKTLQSVVCGESICTQGIGYHIKNLSDTNFKSFITDIQELNRDDNIRYGFMTYLINNNIRDTANTALNNQPGVAPKSYNIDDILNEFWDNWAKYQLDVISLNAYKKINGESVPDNWVPTTWTSYQNQLIGTTINQWMTTKLLQDAFIEGFKKYNTEMIKNKPTIITNVSTYDIELAKLIGQLQYTDDTWNMLQLIKTKDDIQSCECRGNPLNLSNGDKIQVLTILNYLATLSNGDPRKTISQKLSSMQYYLITLYSCIVYIIFHSMYNIFDRKIVVGGYFVLLIIISAILGLMARLS